jgi:hypothetical protein
MEKKITHKKKKFVPTAFKFMVAVGSLAGTVGIWNILANKELLQASAQNTDPTSIAPALDQPLPTIVPLMSINVNSQFQTSAQPTLTVRDVTISTNSQAKNTASASGSGVTTFSAPTPLTTTQTSKKP